MTITKDQSITFPVKYVEHEEDYSAGWVFAYDNTATFNDVVKAERTRTGSSLPKWKTIILNGGDATTALSAVYDEIYCEPVSCRHKWVYLPTGGGRIYFADGDFGYAVLPIQTGLNDGEIAIDPLADPSRADNFARARFYKKLREVQVQFSGPTFFGELRETLRMIRSPAQAIRDSCDRYYRSLKQWKGRNRPPAAGPKSWDWRRELTKTAGGLWLENSFGWQPLLNDIKNAVAAYERLANPVANTKTISVGAFDGKDVFGSASAMGYGDGQSHTFSAGMHFWHNLTFARTEIQVRYKGKVSLQTEATMWDNAALFGFTPSEFVPTAWELLPWSFLIDYFTNIGDVLTSAVTRTAGVNFVCRTQRSKTRLEGNFVPNPIRPGGFPWDYALVEEVGSRAYAFAFTRKSLSRSSGGGVPLPVFMMENGLNVGQMCNITALLTQFMDIHPQDKPKRNWHR